MAIGRVLMIALALSILAAPAQALAAGKHAKPAGAALTQAALQTMFRGTATPALPAPLAGFYGRRNFQPVWSGTDAKRADALKVRAVLAAADTEGLRAKDYTAPLSRWKTKPPEAGNDAAAYDAALTQSLLRYASNLRNGRFKPRDVYPDVSLPPPDFDAVAALASDLKEDGGVQKYLADLAPVHPGYVYLVQALAHYRTIAAGGGWPVIPAGTKLDPSDKNLALLAKRLAFEDPALAANASPSVDDIRDALFRYKARNALTANDSLGHDVLSVLNVPAAWRVQQIVANMERWRWMPRYLESHYVEVDVPDQSVSYIDGDSALLYSKVVIGTPATPTPILRTTVQGVIANPFWHVPDQLAAAKLLPQLRKKPDYLLARHMMLADGPANDPYGTKVDWRGMKATDLRYQIEQKPGADNALGTILFDMPNEFDVYLHDTPEKKLFTLAVREKSNGCVRVEKIAQLASLVLTGGDDDSDSDLSDAVDSGQNQHLPLDGAVAVYMLYWTAIAEPDGTVHFRPDRYGRDHRLIAKL
jgi:murein L,D-transpeptidase YcbB/YkuD